MRCKACGQAHGDLGAAMTYTCGAVSNHEGEIDMAGAGFGVGIE